MDSFEQELKVGFLDEARDLLTNTEQCFLNLEKASNDPSIIEKIFRLAHNLKGSAGAVGFNDLGHFTHTLESFLLKVKNKDIPIDDEVISTLLACNDFLIQSIDSLKLNLDFKIDGGDLHGRLEAMIAGLRPQTTVAEVEIEPNQVTTETQSESETGLHFSNSTSNFSPDSKSETTAGISPISPHVNASNATSVSNSEGTTGKNSKTTSNGAPPPVDETVRVSLSKIDELLNNVGELVILQTVMFQQRQNAGAPLLQKTISEMSKIVKEVQSLSMSLRMLPVKQVFQKMQRIVRDTSKALGKEVDFVTEGEETELDKTVLEQLGDPLVHLVRNAVDHGLEMPDERRASGKNFIGKIKLTAFQQAGQITIEITDDGKGLDPSKLIKIAKSRGVIPQHSVLTDDQAYQLIFAPGFSTKEKVTDVSGRGVGMDVVKTNIANLQGEIELKTVLGKGTVFRIHLPLTLAIVDGMVVTHSQEKYVIPLSQVTEFFQPKREDISYVNERGEVLNLRGQSLPIYRLDNLLKKKVTQTKHPWASILLIAGDSNSTPFAIIVDDILCQQQVVIKRLGEEIRNLPGISGASILGDGKASLILDLNEMTSSLRKNKKPSLSQEAS